MFTALRLLILEDDPYDAELEIAALEEAGYECRWERVETRAEFLACLDAPDCDLILADYSLPAFDGLTALKLFHERDLDLPFILVSGILGEEIAIESLKAGATDYVLKSRLSRLVPVVQRALREKEEQRQRRRTEGLLQSLNLAARAMGRALTPDDTFIAVSEEFAKFGVMCTLFLTDDRMSKLFPKYLGHEPKTIEALENLVGIKAERFSISIADVDLYRKVVWEKEAVFLEDCEEAMRQVLPGPAKIFAGQIVTWLKMRTFIATPLVADDKVIGVLTVQSEDLVQDDVPTITAFAHQMASAWRKAQLFEQAQQEIAERKRAEEELRESEERYRLHFENVNDVIFSIDPDLRVISVSPSVERFLGCKPDELIGRPYQELNLMTADSRMVALSNVKHVFAGERIVSSVYEFNVKDGTRKFGEVSSAPLIYGGEVVAVVSVARDVTERVRAEEERERLLVQIRDQAQRMQQIMDTVPEGVLLLDANGQVLLANPVAEGDLSVLAGAKVGDTITRVGGSPLAKLLISPPKGLWHKVEVSGRTFEIIARPLENGPESEDWVLVINDVTQEREIQRRIQQQERLVAVGQLAAGIAHDFNNIMATIVLYAQMSARMEGLPESVRERMVTINQQAQHATRLIRQMLDFSRRAVLERRPLDLLPLLKEQVQMLERALPESIGVDLIYGPDEYVVNADPTRMQQVVMNLALNARDAMPEGGILRIALERIEIKPGEIPPLPEMGRAIENREWVRVTVSDTGIGIQPDDLPYIFDPFFTTKSPGEGSGLGLAQVHGIVGQHEGHIDVESQVGRSTTFTIHLPALPGRSSEPITLELPPLVSGQGETVLVVEDDLAARQALVESLELLNYRVLAAPEGQEALAILERHGDEIALVLSDVVMPGMGGIALLHALRERGLDVSVVMLTGHPLEGEMEYLRSQGLIDWLAKPPDLERLAQVVAQALKRARVRWRGSEIGDHQERVH